LRTHNSRSSDPITTRRGFYNDWRRAMSEDMKKAMEYLEKAWPDMEKVQALREIHERAEIKKRVLRKLLASYGVKEYAVE
jgi:precorrin-3B methylase